MDTAKFARSMEELIEENSEMITDECAEEIQIAFNRIFGR